MKKGVASALVVLLVLGLGVAGVFAIVGGGDASNGASSSGPTASTTSTTRVEFSGDGAGPYCEADARLNEELTAQVPASNDPAAVEAFFDQRLAAIRELEQLAPDEIKPDVSITVGAFEAFRPVFAGVGWDESQVSAADTAVIQSPEVVAAGQRLQQYGEQVCSLAAQG